MENNQPNRENPDKEDKFEDAIEDTDIRSTSRRNSAAAADSPDVSPAPDSETRPRDSAGSIDKVASKPVADQGEVDSEKPQEAPEDQQPPAKTDQPVESIEPPEAADVPTTSQPVDQPKPPPRPSRFQGFSASLPSVPWAAPPPPPKKGDARAVSPQPPPAQPNPPTGFGRKVTTPFGWLSRATSSQKDLNSPPIPSRQGIDARRNTAASTSTLGSNPDLSTRIAEDGQENLNGHKHSSRGSLREQFKLLRLREEAGVTNLDDLDKPEAGAIAGLVGRSSSLGAGLASPASIGPNEHTISSPILPPTSPLTESVPVNPNLAPGTVSGVSAAPADLTTPIDWDFWQQVVNEGPQAVARTSPEEFTQAISGGIPQTIRPVIWQVLAGSKNDDLEAVYWDLRSQTTSQEAKDAIPKSPLLNGNSTPTTSHPTINGGGKEKESVASSKSSIRSDHSTPATSANLPVASPSPSAESPDPVKDAKLQTELAALRAKKAKDDAVALAKLEKVIKRDMGSRTSYSKYAAASGLQDALFNVCRAYALYDDAVGYPQGLNFIIMPILFTMPEEETFCLLVRLMNKYQLRDLFVQDMPGLHLHLYQFERLLEDLEPALYCHLNRRGVTPKLYATQWFLTLFAYRFPLQLVMRVYDLILCEGLEGAILKFGMAVIQRNVSTLLTMNDMQALTNFLKEKLFDVYIDAAPSSKSILESGFFGSSGGSDNEVYRADLLVQDACAVNLTPEMLARYREEFETTTKAEKARETELENLRTDCATKAAQIRSLEKRAEKSDAEHIELANELVRLKVENTEYQDRNESLSGQVEELRKVAESEAANVEERMRATTEQVMQRNIEVQNENRHMEEQMAEMERELVEYKMKYAELNGEHDSLKLRWNDLKRALE